MKNSGRRFSTRSSIITCIVFFALASLPMLSNARTGVTSVSIVNNSSRVIRNVYLSHVNADDWSENQLGDTTIASGQSFNPSNVACDAQQVKVIAEDENGCFLSTVINCGENSTWTITNDTAGNCGN